MKKFKSALNVFLILAIGFSGGVLGSLVFSPKNLDASDMKAIATHYLQLVTDKRLVRAELVNEGEDGGALNFYDDYGRLRIILGTGNKQGKYTENGLPFLAFFDDSQRMRMQMKFVGPNQAPTLMFKDQLQNDRLILGLDPNEVDELPYIAYRDIFGEQHMVFVGQ